MILDESMKVPPAIIVIGSFIVMPIKIPTNPIIVIIQLQHSTE